MDSSNQYHQETNSRPSPSSVTAATTSYNQPEVLPTPLHYQPPPFPPLQYYLPETNSRPSSAAESNSRPSSASAATMQLMSYNQPQVLPPPLHYQPPLFPPLQYYQPPALTSSMFPPPPHYYYHQDATLNIPMIHDWRQGVANHNVHRSLGWPWSTGLFDCLLDFRSCFMGCFCPWITFGEIAEIVTQGNTPWYEPAFFYAFLVVCFLYPTCFYSSCYRTRVRRQYDLQGSRLEDFVLHCLCEPCALCQLYRELQHHGFDVSLGWEKNKERERLAREAVFQVPPVVEQGMRR